MTDQERQEVVTLLTEAAAKVEAALAVLDSSTHACERCGSRLFDQYDEMRVRERLDPTPEKLRIAASRLRNSKGAAQICSCTGGRPIAV